MKFKIAILLTVVSFGLIGQDAGSAYIKKYKNVAVREMKAYGIPASITLAQGILESGNGKSYLATEANNHFGIKCHQDWKGGRVYHDDDKKNECFRSYKNAEESFKDHSLFLSNRGRYSFLFDLKPTDYKAWAKGLKKAGYATNPKYPQLLIDLIERYELYQYDSKDYKSKEPEVIDEPAEFEVDLFQQNITANHVQFYRAKQGDSYESIAETLDMRVHKLLKYNDLSFEANLKSGDIVYTKPKRKKSHVDQPFHTVRKGETMHSISQLYAVKLRYLYQWNHMEIGTQPGVGQKLRLR